MNMLITAQHKKLEEIVFSAEAAIADRIFRIDQAVYSIEERLAILIAKQFPHWAQNIYDIRIEGKEYMKREAPLVVLFKHQSIADFAGAAAVLSQLDHAATIAIKKSWFKHAIQRIALTKLGGVPMPRPKDRDYDRNSAEMRRAMRELIGTLRQKNWFIYTPEGTRVRGKIADELYMGPVAAAARMNIDVIIVGIEYVGAGGKTPWLLWRPGNTIIFRAHSYNATNKTEEQMQREIRPLMARLSGLTYTAAEIQPTRQK